MPTPSTTPPLIAELRAHLRAHVFPRACEIDQRPEALAEAMDGLGERGWLALRRPEAYGGPEASDVVFCRTQIEVARASGALAFLSAQHQSAVSMIARGHNDALKREQLPKMGAGHLRCGIGYSQLRRPGPPAVTATPNPDGGYVLDGVIPWVTGARFFSQVLVGATAPDGGSVFGLVPLADVDDARGSLTLSQPMTLAALEVARTVSVRLSGWKLSEASIVAHHPVGWLEERDRLFAARQGFFILGTARGAVDLLDGLWRRREDGELERRSEGFASQLDDLEARLLAAVEAPDAVSPEAQLSDRGEVIALAGRCAHAAVVATGGAANMLGNDAQRIYREVLLFTVLSQTAAVRHATLNALG